MMTGTTLGIGSPFINTTPNIPWAFAPQSVPQGLGYQSYVQPPYLPPLLSQLSGGYGSQPIAAYGFGTLPLLQQLQQLVQIVPQQLQQIHLLHQQQLVHLQQLLQQVPAQLQQLAQMISQQHQQQWQPFPQTAAGPLGLGLASHPFGGQVAGPVM